MKVRLLSLDDTRNWSTYQTQRTDFGCQSRRCANFTTSRSQVDNLDFIGILLSHSFMTAETHSSKHEHFDETRSSHERILSALEILRNKN